MTPTAELTLVTELSTTVDVAPLAHPRWLAGSLEELFEVEDLLVTWVPEGRTEARRARWSALSDAELAGIHGLGGIALSDLAEQVFEAAVEWLDPADTRAAVRMPLGQNGVTLRFAPVRVTDGEFRAAYLRWVAAAAEHFDATYVAAHNQHVHHFRLAHAEGLGAGLRDVYWLNVFGRAFCDLIGEDRLLSAPAAHTGRLGSRHVLVLADDAVLEPPPHGDAREPWPPTRAHLDPIVDHIGREFFVKPPLAPPQGPPVLGLFRGLRRLRGRGAFDDPTVVAERRPDFGR